jgi:hypothetical protein
MPSEITVGWHIFLLVIPIDKFGGCMNIWNRGTRIPEIYGTLVTLALIVYFFIMYAAGLIHVIELRFFNLIIMLAGVYFAQKQFKRTHNGRLDYFRSMTTGVATTAIAASAFSIFVLFYLKLDRNLMNSIAENEPLGFYLDPYICSFAVFFEGLFSGFGLSYLLSNFFATDIPATDHVAEHLPEKV